MTVVAMGAFERAAQQKVAADEAGASDGASLLNLVLDGRVGQGGAMKPIWYLLTVLLGALGALGLLRGLERLVFDGGQGPLVMQFLIGFLASYGAWRCLQRARASSAPLKGPTA